MRQRPSLETASTKRSSNHNESEAAAVNDITEKLRGLAEAYRVANRRCMELGAQLEFVQEQREKARTTLLRFVESLGAEVIEPSPPPPVTRRPAARELRLIHRDDPTEPGRYQIEDENGATSFAEFKVGEGFDGRKQGWWLFDELVNTDEFSVPTYWLTVNDMVSA
jgi:hypothetical protein